MGEESCEFPEIVIGNVYRYIPKCDAYRFTDFKVLNIYERQSLTLFRCEIIALNTEIPLNFRLKSEWHLGPEQPIIDVTREYTVQQEINELIK